MKGEMGHFIVKNSEKEVPVMFATTWEEKQAGLNPYILEESLQFMDIWSTLSLVRSQNLDGLFTCWRT